MLRRQIRAAPDRVTIRGVDIAVPLDVGDPVAGVELVVILVIIRVVEAAAVL